MLEGAKAEHDHARTEIWKYTFQIDAGSPVMTGLLACSRVLSLEFAPR